MTREETEQKLWMTTYEHFASVGMFTEAKPRADAALAAYREAFPNSPAETPALDKLVEAWALAAPADRDRFRWIIGDKA